MNINNFIQESINIKTEILNDEKILLTIQQIAKEIVNAYNKGKKVLIAGNGGSAADAQHVAGELVSKLSFDREPLSAVALTTDTSVLTAIGNDYGYEFVFSRQIKANGCEGDIFIGISTSGKSKNIISAFEEAKSKGMITIGLFGENSCDCVKTDYSINVPSNNTPRIQETHIMIEHIICALVEEMIFG